MVDVSEIVLFTWFSPRQDSVANRVEYWFLRISQMHSQNLVSLGVSLTRKYSTTGAAA